MKQPWTLGRAQPEELPRIVALKRAMFVEAGKSALLPDDAEQRILRDYQTLYRDQQARHFVARAEGEIVAMVGAFIKDDLPYRYFDPAEYGFIGDVYTQSAFRQQGLAQALSEQALAWLQQRGIRSVRLLAADRARDLYARLGFKASDEMWRPL